MILLKIIFLPFFVMTKELEIEKISETDLETIYKDFSKKLTNKIDTMYDQNHIKNTLVEDICPKKNQKNVCMRAVVLDVGGSFFKIALVKLFNKNEDISYEIEFVEEIKYPDINNRTRMTFWFEWVASQYIETMVKKSIVPDFCSLIFSYPIRYDGDESYAMNLAKHWCFEIETTLSMDLKRYLNDAIKIQFEIKSNDLDCNLDEKKIKNYLINSVLNDSVATLLSSKLVSKKKSVGIILGTGTNGAMFIEYNGKQYVYNTEWGSYRPNSLNLLPEERSFIKSLDKNYNMLDILVGNGYKWNLINEIIKNRNIDVKLYEKDCLGDIMNRDNEDIYKKIANGLIYRSRQIMSMLVCSLISKYESSEVTILLNGSGYGDELEREAFLKMINEYKNSFLNLDVNINIHYENGLTFIGAAYYAYASANK